MARRGNDGEHGYGGGAATVASAMAWEREGEELGANGGVQEGRGATWSSSRPSGRREGGGRAACSCVASCGAAAEHLGCLPGKPSSSLERWPGWAGQVGWLVGLWWRQVSFPFFFLFLFF